MVTKQEYAEHFGRWIEPNEIIIEFDKLNNPEIAIYETCIALYYSGFNFEYWKAEKQKSGHIHIKNFPRNLSEDYKKAFLEKYIPEKYLKYADFKLCSHHRIAEENKAHYKGYGIKKLLGHWNNDKQNFIEQDLIKIKKSIRKINVKGSGITAEIVKKLSIISLARQYGFNIKKNRATCLLHNGSNPTSLSFDDEKGLFFCHSCQRKGNIIDFIKECKIRGLKRHG